jgi:hypothetical protein
MEGDQTVCERLVYDRIRLHSIRQINHTLPVDAKQALYRSLIPAPLLSEPALASPSGTPPATRLSIQIRCPETTGFVEIDVRHPGDPRDPVLYVHMTDTASGQLEVLLLQVNAPHTPRYDIDRDWHGETTKLGTLKRNIPAEIAAMEAGMAPGQIRPGLHLSRRLIPAMERFTVGLGKDRFFIDPLAYHNAIMFERYGFAYVTGRARMEAIHRDFQPGGTLYQRLDGSTPFRRSGAGETIRGRSWAIHDGITEEAWDDVRMYKRVDHHACICTFPGARY